MGKMNQLFAQIDTTKLNSAVNEFRDKLAEAIAANYITHIDPCEYCRRTNGNHGAECVTRTLAWRGRMVGEPLAKADRQKGIASGTSD